MRTANLSAPLFSLFLFHGIQTAAQQQQVSSNATAITDTTKANTLIFNAEIRPRTEYRNGFKMLRTDSSDAAFFTSQRTRLQVAYQSKKLDVYAALQDVRVWGQYDPRSSSAGGAVQLFEGYIEPHVNDHLSVRIGKQTIVYDNGRLFAANDWRQSGGTHEAARVRYQNKGVNTEFTFAFNQSAENLFSTTYYPAGFANYKVLLVHYLDYKINDRFSILTLNVMDGFQNTIKPSQTDLRFTSGGRLQYSGSRIYATISGYAQYGHNTQSKKLSAYYLQPEIKYSGIPNLALRLGGEYFSGNNSLNSPDATDHSFVPLYGTNHSFNGSMEYFTNKPGDLNDAGLINPYLFAIYNEKGKFGIRADFHLFYSAAAFNYQGTNIGKFLGFENDWIFSYRPDKASKIDLGFSWMSPTNSMAVIKKGGDNTLVPFWSYLMFTYKPQLGKITF